MKAKKQFVSPQISMMKMESESKIMAGSIEEPSGTVRLESMGGWNN